jgi:hypothetical protein
VAITDRSCAAVLGLEPRAYRELVARERIPHVRLGRRVVVRVADIIAALDRIAEDDGAVDEKPMGRAGPEGVDRVLGLIGRTRRTG